MVAAAEGFRLVYAWERLSCLMRMWEIAVRVRFVVVWSRQRRLVYMRGTVEGMDCIRHSPYLRHTMEAADLVAHVWDSLCLRRMMETPDQVARAWNSRRFVSPSLHPRRARGRGCLGGEGVRGHRFRLTWWIRKRCR